MSKTTGFELPLKEAVGVANRLRVLAKESKEMAGVLNGVLGPHGGLSADTSWRDIYAAAIAERPPLWLEDPQAAAITTAGFFDPNYQASSEKIKAWARNASGGEVLFLLTYLEEKNTLTIDEAYAFTHLASRSGIKIDKINEKLKSSGFSCFDTEKLCKEVFDGHLKSFIADPQRQKMPDFIDIAAFRKLFSKLVSLTKEHGVEYSQTGWIAPGLPQYDGKLIFGDVIKGTRNSVDVNENIAPRIFTPEERAFAKIKMVVHTHPGNEFAKFHLSPEDFESLLTGRASSLVMLHETGAGLIAFAGISKLVSRFQGTASDIKEIASIFERHLPKGMPLSMERLGVAAKEVAKSFGISLYLFYPDSDIAECLHKAAF